jgi:hypothetical protein
VSPRFNLVARHEVTVAKLPDRTERNLLLVVGPEAEVPHRYALHPVWRAEEPTQAKEAQEAAWRQEPEEDEQNHSNCDEWQYAARRQKPKQCENRQCKDLEADDRSVEDLRWVKARLLVKDRIGSDDRSREAAVAKKATAVLVLLWTPGSGAHGRVSERTRRSAVPGEDDGGSRSPLEEMSEVKVFSPTCWTEAAGRCQFGPAVPTGCAGVQCLCSSGSNRESHIGFLLI